MNTKTATVTKRDPALAPLTKRLEANRPGLGMAIDDLLFATACKGLKAISDAARTGWLDRMRGDDRFEVQESIGSAGGWHVHLHNEPLAEDPIPDTDEPPTTPTIGDKVVNGILTLGEMLGAKIENGEPAKESTLAQPISETISEAVPPAAAPLTDAETHDLLFKSMEEHQRNGAKLAADFFDLKRQEATQDGALKITRETIKELQKTMASHMAAVPTLETLAQRTIEFDTGAPPAAAEEPWTYALPADQTLSLESTGLTFSDLERKIVGELPYQEKPHAIGEFIIEVKGSRYLIRESSSDDKRWFVQSVHTKDEWQQLCEATYGRAIEDFDQSDEAKDTRQKGGPDCGRVVKAGRAKAVLGPESMGLVIVVEHPPEQATESDARTRAAGDGERGEMGADDAD